MIYREAGQFKSSYASDQAVFPIRQDRVVVGLALGRGDRGAAVADEYWLQAVLIPFLIYSLAALGLNLLTGYAGQVSLGTGGFMAVGAYAAFKLTVRSRGSTCWSRSCWPVSYRAGRAAVRAAVAAHQGLLPGGGHPGRPVLPALALQQGGVVHRLRLLGHHHRAAPHGGLIMVTGPAATAPVAT